MEQKDNRQKLLIDPLRGMDERHEAQPNRAKLVRDMGWLDDAWREAGGFQPAAGVSELQDGGGYLFNNPFVVNAEYRIQSLHWFARHSGGRQYLIWDDEDGNLRQFIGNKTPATPWRNLVDAQHNDLDDQHVADIPWIGTQSTPYGGRLYLVNGYNEPIVFNGRFCDKAGFDNPAPLPEAAVVDRTDGTDPVWMTSDKLGLGIENSGSDQYKSGYRYLVTFVNERGQESPANGTSGDLVTFINDNTTGNKHALWVNIPTGGSNVVARRIYRTQSVYGSDNQLLSRGMGENYYFLREIQDNCTTHYWDVQPDTNLGALLDTDSLGVWPKSSNIIATFKNTTFLAGKTISGRVWFSAPGQPEVFPEFNYFDLNDDIAGPITALYPTKNALVAFKGRGIYLIKGDPANGFFAQTLTRNVGCASPNTLAEVPGQGVMFVDSTGQIHLLEGALEDTGTPTQTIRMSTPLPKQVARINTAALANARGVHDRVNNEYQLYVPTLGSIYNDLCIVYHYPIGEFSIRENTPVSACIDCGDHRGYVIFGSHDTSNNPGLFVLNRGYPTRNGTALQTHYETVDLNLGSVFTSSMPLSVMAFVMGYGDNKLEVNVNYNRAMSSYYNATTTEDGATNISLKQQRVEDVELPHLGVPGGDGAAIWDTDYWAEHRPVPLRFDISSLDTAPVTEMRIILTPAGNRVELRAVMLELHGTRQRGTMLLSETFGPTSR